MKIGIIAENYHCVGTCVTSFNDDGKCIVSDLPWNDLKDFELAEEMAEHLSRQEFYSYVPFDPHVEDEIEFHAVEYLTTDGIFLIYDINTNRHYFFA